ncbi:MAG: M1 family aminopeptidase [Bacteroidota bacterium]|nr:M1 family aminopeptidase [Bacteroidota bacterium]
MMKKTFAFPQLIIITVWLSLFFSSCEEIPPKLIEPGVSLELAQLRNKQIQNICYDITFSIPDSLHKQINGNVIIQFDFNKNSKNPLILDFRNQPSQILKINKGHKKIKYKFSNGHIIIPHKYLNNGENKLEIEFIAGERALNRNEEYLYTLFVPDRACTAFPCFDQPSLKAIFKPTITVPTDWVVVANSPLLNKIIVDSLQTYSFTETEPISTYLFAFVAGKFNAITKKQGRHQITLYHRENDIDKIKRNVEAIFELKFGALSWLEQYTQINYPFKKMDFIAIPSFQYSGMEHPGAVLYRDSKLFLDESASIRDELSRANLIAHETAHMWFGDLVTMEWFSEVWLKEVFANFMADKIVNPQFPEVNHHLNFLINHYPSSYSIDRTKGANPISQKLDNMKNAGTLYGPIIYHKAPIMMKHLEDLTGEDTLKSAVRQYLKKYQYQNATWDNLIQIIDKKTTINLKKWSNVWVYEPGMPHYVTQKAFNPDNHLQNIIIEQKDPQEKGRLWIQNIETIVAAGKKMNYYQTQTKDTFNIINLKKPLQNIDYIFTNANGLGYGYIKMDNESIHFLLQHLHTISDEMLRCALYISFWENMLHEHISLQDLMQAYIKVVSIEDNPQNINLLLGYIETVFWNFLSPDEKQIIVADLEQILWDKLQMAKNEKTQLSYFKTYSRIGITNYAIENLLQIFHKEKTIKKLHLSTRDFTNLAFELSLRDIDNIEEILDIQYQRIDNKERKARFEFICPALSSDEKIRDQFFHLLMDEKNREKEPWVVTAVYYLNHPLRNQSAIKYIRPSLEVLEELQITGDIFFPAQWLNATFAGHSSIEALTEINIFLNENPDYPVNLKNKILQSTDMVFRANKIKN